MVGWMDEPFKVRVAPAELLTTVVGVVSRMAEFDGNTAGPLFVRVPPTAKMPPVDVIPPFAM
jgi:hypothetical protein